jgi:hypothetical protein
LGEGVAKGSTIDVGAGDGAIDRINYSAGIRVTGVGNEDFLYVNNRRMTGAVAVKNTDTTRAVDEAKNVMFAVNGDGDLVVQSSVMAGDTMFIANANPQALLNKGIAGLTIGVVDTKGYRLIDLPEGSDINSTWRVALAA